MMTRQPTSRDDFRFAVICALPLEYDAVYYSFDEVWKGQDEDLGKAAGDLNQYTVGCMGKIPVVLVLTPEKGIAAAASAAASLRSSYCKVKVAFLVGVCGAVPYLSDGSEILLGDVIISKYVVRYGFGKQYADGFKPASAAVDTLGRPDKATRALSALFETRPGRCRLQDQASAHLKQLQADHKGIYEYLGATNDRLFRPTYRHKHQATDVGDICQACVATGDQACEEALALKCDQLGCSDEHLESRDRLQGRHSAEHEDVAIVPALTVHTGGIGSADTVMKSGEARDRISKRDKVIAFEMEGAGMWDEFPCMIIKGVCDYSDSHKPKAWQNFAAAAAASTAKAILGLYFHGVVKQDAQDRTIKEADKCIREYYLANNERLLTIERLSRRRLPMEECFINLAIIERDNASSLESRLRDPSSAPQSSPFSIFSRQKVRTPDKTEQVELSGIFNKRPGRHGVEQPRRVLIRGRAGVGKTTLCKKIVHEFIKGRWSEWNVLFDRVLWVPLRRLALEERRNTPGYNFESLFNHEYFSLGGSGSEFAQALCSVLRSDSSRTLFLLDGLDEVSGLLDAEDGMSRFLAALLDQPSLIITTRPNANISAGLRKFDLELEAVGFYPEQVKTYIERAFTDIETMTMDRRTVNDIYSFLRTHSLLHGLVRIPIQLDALCYTWEDDFAVSSMPETMTGVYNAITQKLWRKDAVRLRTCNEQYAKYAQEAEIEISTDRERYILECLAFNGLYYDIVSFTRAHLNEIARWSLPARGLTLDEMLTRTSFVRTSDLQPTTQRQEYHFIHLTFQEYFAARYFVRRGRHQEQLEYVLKGRQVLSSDAPKYSKDFIRKHKYSARYDVFWRFVTGILDEAGQAVDFLKLIEQEPRDLLGPAHQRLVMHCLSETSENLEIRPRLEKKLAECVKLECRIRGSSLLAEGSECPEAVIIAALKTVPAKSKCAILHAKFEQCWQFSETAAVKLTKLLKNRNKYVRLFAAFACSLQSTTSEAASTTLMVLLKDKDKEVRGMALRALGIRPVLPEATITAVTSLLTDEDIDTRRLAVQILQNQPALPTTSLIPLIMRLRDSDIEIQEMAIAGLAKQANLPEAATTAMTALLGDEEGSFVLRHLAIPMILIKQSPLAETTLSALVTLGKSKSDYIRFMAAIVLLRQSTVPDGVVEAIMAQETGDPNDAGPDSLMTRWAKSLCPKDVTAGPTASPEFRVTVSAPSEVFPFLPEAVATPSLLGEEEGTNSATMSMDLWAWLDRLWDGMSDGEETLNSFSDNDFIRDALFDTLSGFEEEEVSPAPELATLSEPMSDISKGDEFEYAYPALLVDSFDQQLSLYIVVENGHRTLVTNHPHGLKIEHLQDANHEHQIRSIIPQSPHQILTKFRKFFW